MSFGTGTYPRAASGFSAQASHEEVASALAVLSSDDRDTWVRLAMAVKSGLGESGRPIWEAWSKTSPKYQPRSADSVWRSVSEKGGVTIRSLFYLARREGWKFRAATSSRWRIGATQTQLQAKRAEDARSARAEAAAIRARAMLKQATVATHPYLTRKGFPTVAWPTLHGRLLVPMYLEGAVQGIQTIAATGQKRFLPGQKVTGSRLELGRGRRTIVVEGLATGLSVRRALAIYDQEWRVVVAFSARNLPNVSKYYKDCHVVADHDASGTGERYAIETGRNYWTPEELEDANDFHQAHGLRALAKELTTAFR